MNKPIIILGEAEPPNPYDDLNNCEYPEQRARLESESERAQQREDQVTYSVRAKATIKHHCKAHYSTNRKASHRARDTI